jgi:hypothetical protein
VCVYGCVEIDHTLLEMWLGGEFVCDLISTSFPLVFIGSLLMFAKGEK